MIKKLIILTIIIALVILTIRFFSGEDNWVCQNGQWIKHGNPSSLAPKSICK